MDVLFCPFTAPVRAEPDLPVVSVVYDLQHLSYPQFFARQERANRDALLRVLDGACGPRGLHLRATRARRSCAHLRLPAERLAAIPIAVHGRLPRLAPEETAPTLERLGVFASLHAVPRELLAAQEPPPAAGRVRHRCARAGRISRSTSSSPARCRRPRRAARGRGRDGAAAHLHFLGLSARPRPGGALPGVPARRVPVPLRRVRHARSWRRCTSASPSRAATSTSLPEVAGDAALFFDPRRPESIATAIAAAARRAGAAGRLAGGARPRPAGGARRRARWRARYLRRVRRCRRARRLRGSEGLHGLFPDGWLGARAWVVPGVRHGEPASSTCTSASWLQARSVTVGARRAGGDAARRVARRRAGRGPPCASRCDGRPERVHLRLAPVFRPSEQGLGEDQRLLSCQCEGFRLVD